MTRDLTMHGLNKTGCNVLVMAYLHCWTRIQVLTLIQIPNPVATLYYAEHVRIAQTWIWMPIQTWVPNYNFTHFLD